ncbi:MAG: CoA activase [Acidobacteriota bacterium]|jgi:predicted nucleotide-binding protein (sugar kinase/HSP70/actin superfamily)
MSSLSGNSLDRGRSVASPYPAIGAPGPGGFDTLAENVGKFRLAGKKALIADLARAGNQLLAATLRSFGVDAEVMETYAGLKLGKQFTSGKECFPCQITLGDFLHHMERERERLGDAFDAADYVYCMAEAGGPCRYGMYTRLQRIVLDSLGFEDTQIVYTTCEDNYSAEGLVAPEEEAAAVKSAVFGFLAGDVLDRILWRTRPYEREEGQADALFEEGLAGLVRLFEVHARDTETAPIIDELERIAIKARSLIDPAVPAKPLIGLVGEIYVRSHCASNRDLIRMLERHGAEVVNASITEWVHFVVYDLMQRARRDAMYALHRGNLREGARHLREWLLQRLTLAYQQLLVHRVYGRVRRHLPIHADHRIGSLGRHFDNDRLFSFRMGTEAALSIAGALEYQAHGFNGVVNVFPFGCMPSTTCSAVLKPMLAGMRVPYIDAPFDGTDQPNREAMIRTFMHQASQNRLMAARGESK